MVWEPAPGSDPADVVEQLARDILAVFTQAEARLLADIARRARADRNVPEWASQKAAAVRELRLAVERMLTQLHAEAGQAAADAVLAAWQAGATTALAQLWDVGALDADQLRQLRDVIPGMDAAALLAADLTSRLDAVYLRVLRWGQDAYQTAVAAAAPTQLLGTGTTRSAQRAAWDRLVSQGVTGFVDRSGRAWNLSSYVEMATRTATGRAWNEGHLARMDALGVDLVTVSRTSDGCVLCAVWQGRILARTGTAGERTVENELTGEPMPVEVAGTVEEARAAGLMHPNCRHTFLPYIPGVTRAEPVEHDQGAEHDREHLRELERKVRKEKRKEAGALSDDERRLARAKIRALQGEIRDHITATGLNRKRYREQINLGHGDQHAARRRREDLAEQVAEGNAEQTRLDAVTAEQQRRREQERLAAEKAERDRYTDELRGLSDEDLDARLAEAANDETLLDLVLAELDRRQAEQDQTDEGADEDPHAEKWAEVDRLVAEGSDYEQAYAEVFDKDVDRVRREAAIARLRDDGFQGRGFDELARAAYAKALEVQYLAAEAATNGYLLTPTGQRKGLDPRQLWRQNETYARKWASDELKEWWDINGRLTFDQFAAQLLSGGNDKRFRTGGETWLQ
ncbi:phage minor capsid protein [Actinocrispum wychmicini]|uniref:Minor capsid protein 2 n=1 Tax=Actinocrispum wychmicini TaxID=1213861 RepID=A0A4R2JYI4_9PSEU|nr:phage minor capsid protein [Actinocrispum wychmicini]TCO64377.1 minor capsid protein 2 [Actinocrispum wychmicini]